MRPKGAPRALYDKTARAKTAEAWSSGHQDNGVRTWGKKNLYVCEVCEGAIATVDVHDGTTPAFLGCRATEGCTGMMQSQWYPPEPWPDLFVAMLATVTGQKVEKRMVELEPPKVSHEWYRPTPKETKKLDGDVPEYVSRGGLLLREVPS